MKSADEGVYLGRLKEGFYIYSSGGCGDDCAIRLEFVEQPNILVCCTFDVKFARRLAKMLIKVADDYEKGIEH